MSLLKLVGVVAQSKWSALSGSHGGPEKPKPTPAPYGLYQGSVVTLPSIELSMARSDGAVMKPIAQKEQAVTAVGKLEIWGKKVTRSWLADGLSFIQMVEDPANPEISTETILFTSHDEILGRYKRDDAGEYVRDAKGLGIIEEYGLIGWPKFDVNDPPAEFIRDWYPVSPGQAEFGVEPVEFSETLTLSDGSQSTIGYQAMSYFRLIGSEPQTREILLANDTEITQGSDTIETINLFCGIAIDGAALKVLRG
jgi:hypothetical protein